MSNYNYWHGHT